jgi:hypothetical protein
MGDVKIDVASILNAGIAFTVTVTPLEVTGGLQVPLTVTL